MDYGNERSYGGHRGGGYGGGRGGGSFGGRGSGFVPVKEGEELDVTIESVAEKGDGVAKKQGFVIFVPGTKVGDRVKIRVKKVAKKVAFADVIGQGEPAAESTSEPSEAAPAQEEAAAEPEEQYDESQDSEEF